MARDGPVAIFFFDDEENELLLKELKWKFLQFETRGCKILGCSEHTSVVHGDDDEETPLVLPFKLLTDHQFKFMETVGKQLTLRGARILPKATKDCNK
jgi:hypothetical protein